MEKYREESEIGFTQQILSYIVLVIIFISLGYEADKTFTHGQFSIVGWGYSILFIFLWIWRCEFKYTYILTDKEFIIISHGLFIKRTYRMNLADMESFTNKYVKSFFGKTKISHYIHRYSSIDPNPQRLVVFREKTKLAAIIIKGSDKLVKAFRKQMPDKFLDFN